MYFDWRDFKKTLYVVETSFGLLIIAAAAYFLWQMDGASEPICFLIPGIVLFVVGVVTFLFGFEAYLLRGDPDIWR